MLQHIFKRKTWAVKIFMVAYVLLQACNSGESTVSYNADEKDKSADSITETGNSTIHSPGSGAFNSLPNSKDAENAERQKQITMQIDSTYAAISLLDDLKKDINTETQVALTMAERNKKSKAIFNINIIQNELTRAIDASILANLQIRTNELAGITRELEKNVTHLKQVTTNLNKATQTITRLIDILAFGISKGFIKPPTPKGTPPAEIKAKVN